jgi:FK506-binding protein 4/5
MGEDELKPADSAVDISPEKDGGVVKQILTQGEGDSPLSGDKVAVHYVGKLTDGSTFDSSRDREEQFNFNLGKGEVIKGWDIGVATMKIGERCLLFIQSDYGYGPTGSPPKIPGGATLVFDVELFSFTGEDITKDKDGGVIKRVISVGKGYETPNDGARLACDIKGICKGQVFDERSVEFELGEGRDINLPRGLELGLEKMKTEETAELSLRSDYGFGKAGCADKSIGSHADLKYEVTLKSFEQSKESWQLDADQKLAQAKILKDKGTTFFKNGKYEVAASRYMKVIDFLEHEIALKGDEELERKDLLQAGRLNAALCKLKLGDFLGSKDLCSKVLEENNDNPKAWFRRGEAFYALNDWENAKADFVKTLELESDNKAAKNKIAQCEQEIKKYKQKEKKTFANMFDKFAAMDSRKETADNKNRSDPLKNISEWESSGASLEPALDSNSIKVIGDVSMNMDIDKAIEEDKVNDVETEQE